MIKINDYIKAYSDIINEEKDDKKIILIRTYYHNARNKQYIFKDLQSEESIQMMVNEYDKFIKYVKEYEDFKEMNKLRLDILLSMSNKDKKWVADDIEDGLYVMIEIDEKLKESSFKSLFKLVATKNDYKLFKRYLKNFNK